MADDLDDSEFWLPSQLLTEDDITNFGTSSPTTDSTTAFNSDLGSPGESVTETESDKDEFFAACLAPLSSTTPPLPRDWFCPARHNRHSSLSAAQAEAVRLVRSRLPPTKEGLFKSDASAASFDLLNAAAGELAKLRMRFDEQPHQKGTGYFDSSRGFLNPPAKPQTSPVPIRPDFHGGFLL